MWKRCIYGTCMSDNQFRESSEGVVGYFTFPKPETKDEDTDKAQWTTT